MCNYRLMIVFISTLVLNACDGSASSGSGVEAGGLRDFSIVIPNKRISVCVSDSRCVDGDKIRLTINSERFVTTLGSSFDCANVNVNQGENLIRITALNAGGEGACNKANDNTGILLVTRSANGGNYTLHQDSWSIPANHSTEAKMNVTIRR